MGIQHRASTCLHQCLTRFSAKDVQHVGKFFVSVVVLVFAVQLAAVFPGSVLRTSIVLV